MKRRVPSHRFGALALFAVGFCSGCSSSGGAPTETSNDGSVASSSGHAGSSGAPSGSGGSGSGVGLGSASGTGTGGGASGAATSGVDTADGAAGGDDGGRVPTSGSGLGDDAGDASSAVADARLEAGDSSSGGADSGARNCNLPATVSFKSDLLPFLTTSCGGGGGCHVIDPASTASGGGFDHGYDWITAGAHPSSCPASSAGTVPKRFEVVVAVINQANPPSCSHSRKMPPPGATQAPLTPCQIAALQAWLNEPMVTQLHRPDTTSPTTPYPMPPFN